jgi:predicted ATPase
MLREFCELLEALSREGPLVLVLEDLHWSDYTTLDVLTLLARRRDRAPLLVIGTHRPVEVVWRRHPLRAVQQELQIQGLCAELPLDNLSSAEVSAYLTQRFPGNEIPKVVAEVIYRRTEGHPLFMVNLIAYLHCRGQVGAEGGAVDPASGGGKPRCRCPRQPATDDYASDRAPEPRGAAIARGGERGRYGLLGGAAGRCA